MKTFREILNEKTLTMDEFLEGMESSFKKQFPNGYFSISVHQGIGDYLVSVYIGLIDNIKDVSNQIRENDPMRHSFLITADRETSKEREMDGMLTAENLNGDIRTNPPEGSYLAMGKVKTKFRRTKGDKAKLLSTFDKFFKKLKSLVKENEENIYRRDSYPDKYFK